jgi:hypothetical protein
MQVAEVKSLTAQNEETQLRLGLGQVLRYKHEVARLTGQLTVAILVGERRPSDAVWQDLCYDLGVILWWPGNFAIDGPSTHTT